MFRLLFLKLVAYRVLATVPVLLCVIFVAFVLMRAAPGGPFDAERQLSPQALAELESAYKLDVPIYEQFWHYLVGISQGDFGPSFRHPGYSVAELLAQGFPVTVELAAYALIYAILLGVTLGTLAAWRRGTWIDHSAIFIGLVGICLPTFLLGPLLVLLFGIALELFPSSSWNQAPGDKILPVLTLGTVYAAYITRLTRSGMLEVLNQEYIQTARSKGISETRVLFVHALRSGILPTVAFLGPAIASLLTGSFVVETIFQIPGVGRFFVQAAFNRDYTLILSTTILFSVLIITFNLLSDIVVLILDPRAVRVNSGSEND